MKHETYKGRKLKVVKGKGGDWGRTRQYVNGVDQGAWMGDEDAALRQLRGDVDFAESVGVASGRCRPEWFAPGTYELCGEGHAKEIGGLCGHDWCVEQRAEEASAVDEGEPTPAEVLAVDRGSGVGRLIAELKEWCDEVEATSVPPQPITDRFGRVWEWKSGDVYRHGRSACPKALIPVS
jgi:hypothetical protein